MWANEPPLLSTFHNHEIYYAQLRIEVRSILEEGSVLQLVNTHSIHIYSHHQLLVYTVYFLLSDVLTLSYTYSPLFNTLLLMFQIEIQKYFYSNEHLLSISIAVVDIVTYKADFPGRLLAPSGALIAIPTY